MKRSFVLILHLGYWILYLLLILLFILFIQAGWNKGSAPALKQVMGFLRIMGTFTIIPALVSFYIFYGPLFNRYLSQKKITLLIMVGLLTVLMSGFAGFAALNILMRGVILANNGFKEISLIIIFMSILALIHGIIALVMKGFISWYGDIKLKEDLQQKNFETELALVKLQLSPHFLFNTINNIDVLIEKDPEAASAYLNKLSDIMRFMLYETKTELISLQKELAYIEKYMALQKIRSANQDFVQYGFEGDPAGWMIAPMLFIPFIENAFKHSSNKKDDQSIVVGITATTGKLQFFCENKISDVQNNLEKAGGLGNSLMQKRLDLLYPGNHELYIKKQKDIYKVHLVIYNHED